MNRPLYDLRQVTKRYGARSVLAVDQLEIHCGEVLAVVGPSGAGKSTLLRLLNFLEPPTTGTIRFQDKVVNGGQPVPLALRRRITTVFQRPVLLHHSVEANVAYGLRLRHRRHVNDAVEAALAEVGLSALAKQPARTLSGGEAQRVAWRAP